MACIPPVTYSHVRRVCRLYKNALRNLEAWYDRKPIYRFQAVLLRKCFDDYRCITDAEEACAILNRGELELFHIKHPIPRKFANSSGGCAFEREVIPPDWVLDYWHPLEKAQYPEYFAKREQRKKEFIVWWEKQYGKSKKCDGESH